MSRAFIVSDNEFHTALFDAAGKKNIIKFLFDAAGKKNIIKFLYAYNSQYERFRTFINYNGKEDLQKLYESHLKIWSCIESKDLEGLKDCINHHLYDGISASSDIISSKPEYFTKIHS